MPPASKANRRLKLRFTPSDKAKSPYHYIPFTVPQGTECIEVKYAYSDDQATIDLGLFAPGKLGFLEAEGFRGWSGSNKRRAVLCRDWATPGYLPGPIQPGEWNVILGLYKIPPHGCEVTLQVKLHRRQLPQPPSPRHSGAHPNPAPRGEWLRGDLQLHTIHSDGDSHPLEVAAAARKLGLDFIALTDHNTTSQNKYAGHIYGVTVLPGEEVTTYKGHMNVIGLNEWVDFRVTSTDQLLRLHNHLARKAALHYVNHPKPYGPPWAWGHIEEIGAMEVWQGVWQFNNWYSLDTWHRLLAEGHRVLGLGGSDAHRIKQGDLVNRLGTPTVWTPAEDPRSILESLRRGKIVLTQTPRGPFINLQARAGHVTADIGGEVPPGHMKIRVQTKTPSKNFTLRILSGGEVVWAGDAAAKETLVTLDLKAEQRYVSADLVLSGYGDPWSPADRELVLLALTNPIYISNSKPTADTQTP